MTRTPRRFGKVAGASALALALAAPLGLAPIFASPAHAFFGGLSRTNYMLALRSLRMDHPALLEGIAFGQDGLNDSYLVEGSDLSVYNATDESWLIEGGVIDLDGQSSNCPWVSGEGC